MSQSSNKCGGPRALTSGHLDLFRFPPFSSAAFLPACKSLVGNCHAVERLRAAARRAGGGDAGEHGAHQGSSPSRRSAALERSVCSGGCAARHRPSAGSSGRCGAPGGRSRHRPHVTATAPHAHAVTARRDAQRLCTCTHESTFAHPGSPGAGSPGQSPARGTPSTAREIAGDARELARDPRGTPSTARTRPTPGYCAPTIQSRKHTPEYKAQQEEARRTAGS